MAPPIRVYVLISILYLQRSEVQMAKKTVNFRFDEADLRHLEALSQHFGRSRTDVLRAALEGFARVVVMAGAEGEATLAELRRRYPGGLLVIEFDQRDDGEFIPSLTIDGD